MQDLSRLCRTAMIAGAVMFCAYQWRLAKTQPSPPKPVEQGVGWLGVEIVTVLYGSHGSAVKVTYVFPGTPAEKAGIKEGDYILALNGKEMRSAPQLVREITSCRPGEAVWLGILQQRKGRTLPVTLGCRPPEAVIHRMRRNEGKPSQPATVILDYDGDGFTDVMHNAGIVEYWIKLGDK